MSDESPRKSEGEARMPDDEAKEQLFVGETSKRVPKYSTNTLVTSTDDKAVLTFLFKETPQDKENTVIERVMLDFDHVRRLRDILTSILDQVSPAEIVELETASKKDEGKS